MKRIALFSLLGLILGGIVGTVFGTWLTLVTLARYVMPAWWMPARRKRTDEAAEWLNGKCWPGIAKAS